MGERGRKGLDPSEAYWSQPYQEGVKEKKQQILSELSLVLDWLKKTVQPAYNNYKKSLTAWKRWDSLKKRKPDSAVFTTLQPDIHPELSQNREEFLKAKQALYEALRSAQSLPLDNRRRIELLQELVNHGRLTGQLSNGLDFQSLLFPDLSYSITETDLKDADKALAFEPVGYMDFLSRVTSRIGSKINQKTRITN